jgi:hypothetical protein
LNRLASAEEALEATIRLDLKARPVLTNQPTCPWLIGAPAALDAADYLVGPSEYTARAGVTTWLDGVYQVRAWLTYSGGGTRTPDTRIMIPLL